MKKIVLLIVGIIIVSAITVPIAVTSGNLTGRWGLYEGFSEARTMLKELPMEIGHWRAEKEMEMDKNAVGMLRIQDSYVLRFYRNEMTQAQVHMTLMVGPTGRITTHTPEICFGGKDFEKEAKRIAVPITVQLESGKDVADKFWRVNFVSRSSLDASNRISFYYAISTGRDWNAVENPRLTFLKNRFVYKIQVQAHSGIGDDEDAAKMFLEDCLPTIHEYLRQ